MEELFFFLSTATLATRIDPIHVSTLNPTKLVMTWCWLLGGMLLVKSMSSGKPSPLNDDSVDACGRMLEVQAIR